MTGGATVGVDLGGTKIYAVRVEHDEVVAEAKRSTPRDGDPDAVIAAVAATVRRLAGPGTADEVLPGVSLADAGIVGVGVGGPGRVDPATGRLGPAPNLPGWTTPVPVADRLAEELGVAVRVDNDVNAASVAEHRLGAGRGHDDLLTVFVGTGVGGGLVLDGAIRHGAHGLAGELGHIVVEPDGAPCGCGGFGHVEASAGRRGLEARARERVAAGTESLLVPADGGRMTSTVVLAALAAGDPLAVELVDGAARAVGRALAPVAMVVDVELVVMGGGFAERLGAPFLEAVAAHSAAWRFPGTGQRIVPAALGSRAGALGAALLVAPDAPEPASAIAAG
ncbi:MAG TPA: ROK family protein [Acidimicrobiales bacterium]|nr:ROK family protein [Acidimicrobiales bacterium]